ncbi:MAG: UDP-N-acetylglucosamine 2-epimerase (non-hydrolyzing) [Dehalococcoidia bacterium]|nr:UDP-N-acetylglucosamine 2-epimerase (non-hydrolyzing) [Dehalococcoidia bacterium]
MRITTVVGARPQFIKLAPFSAEARRRGHDERIVHTGQHYDEGMSERFFRELGIPEPHHNLGVGSGSHASMTARALEGLEADFLGHRPGVVVVFGDTNSTLAGALAAAKLGIPVVHVEAGLRSFNRSMPEEINRVLVDHAADLLLAPNDAAMTNLANEGLLARAVQAGDIMVDALLSARRRARPAASSLAELGVPSEPYLFVTIHRASNTDDPGNLRTILAGLESTTTAVFPVHPRTRSVLDREAISLPPNVRPVAPLGYVDTVALVAEAAAVVTDSGGLQKEAYLLETPCITLREDTEWVETVDLGWNRLVGARTADIRAAIADPPRGATHPAVYGDGHSAARMLEAIERTFSP